MPAAARDIVLQHVWNGRNVVKNASYLDNLPEQLKADSHRNQGSSIGNGADMQGSATAEAMLESLGYKVFLGGMYSVADYRAM